MYELEIEISSVAFKYYLLNLAVSNAYEIKTLLHLDQIVDVNVTLSAPKVIIPESGKLEENGPLIVADLGRLVLTTEVSVNFEVHLLSELTYQDRTKFYYHVLT